MNRSIIRRLEVLEEMAPKDIGECHVLLEASVEEEQKTTELKASSKWNERDNLMVIRLVAGERGDAAR